MLEDSKHFSNKEKFDREFIVTSNTLYQFYLYIKRYPLYIPYIEQKLKENEVPEDFKYLVIVESALKNDSISSA
jgi:membrane-bound lytic murein transglycosylase D